jgi:hypothetical protein
VGDHMRILAVVCFCSFVNWIDLLGNLPLPLYLQLLQGSFLNTLKG